jgi:hypothetical protein
VKLLAQRDFWPSRSGDALFFIALQFAVLDDLDGGAGDVGLVLAAQTVPFAVFALGVGSGLTLTHLHPRRPRLSAGWRGPRRPA